MSAALILGLAHIVRLSPLATDSGAWLLAAGPVGAAATYWLIYRRSEEHTSELQSH